MTDNLIQAGAITAMNLTKYLDAPERLVAKVFERSMTQPNGCVIWTGNDKPGGYGQISYRAPGSRKVALYVHRLVYVKLVGPIFDDMQVDHRCHDPNTCNAALAEECQHRRCVNPEHLVLTTPRENTLRSGSLSALNAAKTVCQQGHEYFEHRQRNGKVSRRCKICSTAAKRKELVARREIINARKRALAAKIREQRTSPEERHQEQTIAAGAHLLGLPAARELRKSAGLSQETLGQLFGASQTCIWAWETGQRKPSGAAGASYVEWLLSNSQDLAA